MPALGRADLLEWHLLSLSDEDWRKLPMSTVRVPTNGGPAITGDPIVDRWERELFESLGDEDDDG